MGECGQKTKFLEESVKGDTEISLDFNLCIYISQQLKKARFSTISTFTNSGLVLSAKKGSPSDPKTV